MFFNDLFFIFELANNHQGNVAHAKKIIDELAIVKRRYDIKAAIKLQYRNLSTFIHPAEHQNKSNKHVQRFLSTKLEWEEFKEIVNYIKELGFLAMVTPFDEGSVDKIIEHSVDIVKIASCSIEDWPLLEKICEVQRPIIFSTGGATIDLIDSVVTFFSHHDKDFALLHCVAKYPCANQDVNISLIARYVKRYKNIPIGYSGHEDPNDSLVQSLALAAGARIFERHVGVARSDAPLNAYTLNPEQIDKWVRGLLLAKSIVGTPQHKIISQAEKDSILSLKRGVFVKNPISNNSIIEKKNVFYAFPCKPGQLTSGILGSFHSKIYATKDYQANEAITAYNKKDSYLSLIRLINNQAKGVLSEANIMIPAETQIEISHHYGLENFFNYGCVLFNLINRNYANKYIVVFDGQMNPAHLHKIKEETFRVLYGSLEVVVDGKMWVLNQAEQLIIYPNQLHSFKGIGDAIFEEISSTHQIKDSFYDDETINQLDVLERKTITEFKL